MARVEVDGLSKRFGSTLAVDDLSFVARAGQVTGFLGPNGLLRGRRRDRHAPAGVQRLADHPGHAGAPGELPGEDHLA